MNDHRKDAGFDAIADDYDRLWAQSLGQSGEGPQYFLEYKMRCLERLGLGPEAAVLDFGCGTGNLTALLSERHTRVAGYDPSHKSLEIARRHAPKAHFHADVSEIPDASFRVAVLSGGRIEAEGTPETLVPEAAGDETLAARFFGAAEPGALPAPEPTPTE